MHLREASTTFLLVVLFLFSALLTGCGGEDQTGNGRSQDGAGGQDEQDGGPTQKRAKPPEFKVALGSISRVNTEAEKFVLRPSTEEQGKRVIFKVRKNAEILQSGEKVELADVEKGQQAQVRYVVRNDREIAVRVRLFGGTGTDPEGGEKTPQGGETSKGGEKTG